jgi:hypothetical protein
MRSIRYSLTFYAELAGLLEQGFDRFGPVIIAAKRDAVFHTVKNFLVNHPVRAADPGLGIWSYPVRATPFVIVYDYDDSELRIHLVIHKGADRTKVDLSGVVW